jgi:hypothetical protein
MFGTGVATPVPLRETFKTGKSGSLELMVREAVFAPVEDGLNITVTVQPPLATIISATLPQGLVPPDVAFSVKFPVDDRLIIKIRSAPPKLIMVTCKAGDEVPTVTLPKLRLIGTTTMTGMGPSTPSPLSETIILGKSGSFESIVSVAVSVPVDDGPNVTLTVQLSPGVRFSDVLPQGFVPPDVASSVKFVVLDRLMPEMLRVAAPALVIVISKADDEAPTATNSKSWLAGATKMYGGRVASPNPVRETLTVGVSGSFEVMMSVAVSVPVDVGPNVTLTVQLLPAPRVGAVLPHGLPPPLRFKE